MGSEDSFRKRREKTRNALQRKQAKRLPYERVLIVCEGEKTEPYYLQVLIDEYELNTANVVIDGHSNSSPISVVRYAKQKYMDEKRRGDSYDKVYCVFDKDTHTTYQNALTQIAKEKPKEVFHAITSVPCFEYWL